ncbi:NAD-binding protein, partial [Candidatus Woesearchaeota archaeon]|nr:NAD-binding protein [Candidatus Woesearchaeota archaeon]
VDFNPEVIKKLMQEGIHCIYGDIGDSELINRLKLKNCKLIVSTIPEVDTSLLIMRKYKEINDKGLCFLTSENIKGALELYEKGADYVIVPRMIGGHHVSNLIEETNFKHKNILKTKIDHIDELNERGKHATRNR